MRASRPAVPPARAKVRPKKTRRLIAAPARVWPHLVEVFALYEKYQGNTSRDIPVVRLHPLTSN